MTGAKKRRPHLRKQYQNTQYPVVLLRFEDGHEIRIDRGKGKTFDAWLGERIKIVAIYDPSSAERVLVATKLGEEFEDA